jgi:pyridoxine/pyridoxamine 5'-phosphate oxidase
MTEPLSRDDILAEASRLAANHPGGTLATTHAEDGTPYVTFVLFHLRGDGEVLFGSNVAAQHVRNIQATPEASFLIDNREVIPADPPSFCRVVIEGHVGAVATHSARYEQYLAELRVANSGAAYFAENGALFRIMPRRLILMRGAGPDRSILNFEEG